MSRRVPLGLSIVGCDFACGKTAFLTGLACSLQEEGMASRAIKPICTGDKRSAEAELTFISTITHTPLNYPVQYMVASGSLKQFEFAEAVRVALASGDMTLVELPGSAALPLSLAGCPGSAWKDTCDFACEIGYPTVVVARYDHSTVEKLILNATYLQSRGLKVIGLVAVKTRPEALPAEIILPEAMGIASQEKLAVPYLGSVEYSPSVSVEHVNQGNVIKTTSQAIDLLPVITALNLTVTL